MGMTNEDRDNLGHQGQQAGQPAVPPTPAEAPQAGSGAWPTVPTPAEAAPEGQPGGTAHPAAEVPGTRPEAPAADAPAAETVPPEHPYQQPAYPSAPTGDVPAEAAYQQPAHPPAENPYQQHPAPGADEPTTGLIPTGPASPPAGDQPAGQPGDQTSGLPAIAGGFGVPPSGAQLPGMPAGSGWQQPGPYGPAGPGGPPFGPPGPPVLFAQPGPGSTPPGRTRRFLVAGIAAAVLVVAGGLVGGITVHALDGSGPVASPVVSSQVSDKKGSLADMVDKVRPSVVSINVRTGDSGDGGSGVIIRSDGMILTNNHVVETAANGGGGQIQVQFSNGKTASASVVGTDAAGDIAVIKANGVSGLAPATLGDSSKLRVGDSVVAIGSPLGLDGSVTEGIVSALNRSYQFSDEQQQQPTNPFGGNGNGQGQGGQGSQGGGQGSTHTIPDAIQTDAAINPGNSGGPLLNTAGQVIGINSAIRGASDGSGSGGGQAGNIGIGFAIPINTANNTAGQLMKNGKVQHAYLGVQVGDATADNGNAQGAAISGVVNGGPAQKAGLTKGDVVTKIDSTDVQDADGLVAAVAKHKPGDKITITYTRGGSSKTAQVTLGNTPS